MTRSADIRRLLAACAIAFAVVAPVTAQESKTAHADTAKPAPITVVPPKPKLDAVKTQDVIKVTPALPPAQVAKAVAEALREAEAAAARRASRTAAPPTFKARSVPASESMARPARHYEVHWPTQRLVVKWPSNADDRVRLVWPESLTAEPVPQPDVEP